MSWTCLFCLSADFENSGHYANHQVSDKVVLEQKDFWMFVGGMLETPLGVWSTAGSIEEFWARHFDDHCFSVLLPVSAFSDVKLRTKAAS